MTRQEGLGAVFIVLLFVVLCVVLVLVTKRPESTHSPAESPIVQQRIINLQKGK